MVLLCQLLTWASLSSGSFPGLWLGGPSVGFPASCSAFGVIPPVYLASTVPCWHCHSVAVAWVLLQCQFLFGNQLHNLIDFNDTSNSTCCWCLFLFRMDFRVLQMLLCVDGLDDCCCYGCWYISVSPKVIRAFARRICTQNHEPPHCIGRTPTQKIK
jgi:hypothetical protein